MKNIDINKAIRDAQILNALRKGDKTASEIKKSIEETFDNGVSFPLPTLTSLRANGYITRYANEEGRSVFHLEPSGSRQLCNLAAAIKNALDGVLAILDKIL